MTCTVNGIVGPKRHLHMGIHGSESFFLDLCCESVNNARPPFTRVRMTCPPQVPAGLHSQTFYSGICADTVCLCCNKEVWPVTHEEEDDDE